MAAKHARQLAAIRATLIATLEQVDALLDDEVVVDKETCEHPKDARKDMSSMGVKRWVCTVCGYVESQDGEGVK